MNGAATSSVIAIALAAACGPRPPTPSVEAPEPTGLAPSFAYRTTAGDTFSSSTTRGRPVVLAFVATFDLASQVQVRVVDEVVRFYALKPRAIALVLEPRDREVLADAFRTAMNLSFPVAVLDVSGSYDGAFGTIDRVPSVVVLDEDGVEVWRKAGLASPREIREALGGR